MKFTFFIFAVLLNSNLFAGDDPQQIAVFQNHPQKYMLLEQGFEQSDSLLTMEEKKLSGIRAAVYSAILPGAGQYYTKSYWRAAFYAALEVAAWSAYFIYDAKGLNQDKKMKKYADQHWSEHRYWSKLYYDALQNPELIGNLPQNELIVDPDDPNGFLLAQYDQSVINSLRYLETALDHTHRLPGTKTQQYYEMIYKYLGQFGNAWDDAIFLYEYDYGDPLTPHVTTYRGMRNLTDEFFDNASTATMVSLANHVISALDAAWSAGSYNRSLEIRFNIQNKNINFERVKLYGLQFSW